MMWRMMQQSQLDDYFLATGVVHSVEAILDAVSGISFSTVEITFATSHDVRSTDNDHTVGG